MIRLLESFDPYATAQLPAFHKWASVIGVLLVPDVGRSGATGDNAAYFDTFFHSTLSTPLTIVAQDGIYTATLGLAVQNLTCASTVTLASISTAITRFDLQLTSLGQVLVTQTTGGVLLGTCAATANGVVPIGVAGDSVGGAYIALQIRCELGDASAVQISVSDQAGDMNLLAEGPLFALLASELPPATLTLGGGLSDGDGTWLVDDVYVTDGVPTEKAVNLFGEEIFNDSFLGNVHITTFYATGDGANLTIGNTPWVPKTGTTAYNMIFEHPPDEDVTYISADTSGQLTTCLYQSPFPQPFGRQNCEAFAPIFGLQWDGRIKVESGFIIVDPIVRRVVGGTIATDIIARGTSQVCDQDAYTYYLAQFDRDPTADFVPWTFAVFFPAGVGVPGTVEFGVELE